MGRYTQRPDTGRWPATHPCLQLTLCLAGWFTHLFHRVRRIARDRHALPKMSFPRFTGANPTIWKDKCLDYFRIFNIPEVYWVTAASMHMDDNASKWLQMHKLTHDLDSWTEFISAVVDHFGSYDYRDAIGELVSLTQDGTLEDYISAFVDLQYQVTMHNTGFDQVYFVTQFIKGLKHELRMGVQS